MSHILLLQKSYRKAFSTAGSRCFHKVYDSSISAYPRRKEPSELRRKQAAENLKANRVSRHLFSEDSLSDEGVMYLKLITQCKFDKHLAKCFKILEHCRQRKEIHRKHYGAAMKICNKFRRPDKSLELLEQMKEDSIQPDVVVFTTLLHGFAKNRSLDETKQIWDRMEDNKIAPNLISYSTLLHAYSLIGNIKGVNSILEEMQDKNIQPDIFFIADMINACSLESNLTQAKQYFELIKKFNLIPNLDVYHALMKCGFRTKNGTFALEIFTEIETNSKLEPNEQTFHHLLTCLVEPINSQLFDTYWKKYITIFGIPDSYNAGVRLRSLNLRKQHEEVIKQCELVIEKHNEGTINELLRAHLALHQSQIALRVFQNLPHKKHSHFTTILHYFLEQKDYEKMDKIFNECVEKKELQINLEENKCISTIDLHNLRHRHLAFCIIRKSLLENEHDQDLKIVTGVGLKFTKEYSLRNIMPNILKEHLDISIQESESSNGGEFFISLEEIHKFKKLNPIQKEEN